MRFLRHSLSILSATSALSVLAPDAAAQATAPLSGAQLVARRTLLERAQAAARVNDNAHALAYAEQAGQLEMTASLRMFLAQQYQALHRYVEAMENAEFCIREATRSAGLERRDTILTECRRLASSSQGQVVLLTLTVSRHGTIASGAEILLRGRPVELAQLNQPIALDPGPLQLEVRAPGIEAFQSQLEAGPGYVGSLEIPPRFLQREAATQNAIQPPPNDTNRTTRTSTGAGTGDLRSVNPIAVRPRVARSIGAGPWIVLGGSALAFGAAAGFFVARNAQFTTCRPVGDEVLCDTDADTQRWRAGGDGAPDPYTFNSLTNISLATGSVLLAAGASWLVIAALTRREEGRVVPTGGARTAVTATFNHNTVGIHAMGTF